MNKKARRFEERLRVMLSKHPPSSWAKVQSKLEKRLRQRMLKSRKKF